MLYIIIWGNKMNNHKLLKIAGVLLLSAVMLLSATAVAANTGITKKDYVFNNTLKNPVSNNMGSRAEYLNESFTAGIPGTWTQQLVALTYYWDKYYGGWDWGTGAVPPAPHTLPWNVMFEPTTGPEGAITKLITPAMDISAASGPTVSFWYAMHVDVTVQPAHTGQEIITVYYKTSLAGSWVAVPGGHFASDISVWKKVTLPLPSPSATYYIAFEGEYHWGYGACLDDVVVASGGGGNLPPVTPAAPTGPTSGFTGVSYSFSATTTDPDGDNISYMFDWGNGNLSSWIGPYSSGGTATTSYAWASAGSYNVKVKAKDSNDVESGWSPAHAITITAGPTIEIGAITGGLFKVKAVIKNTGGGAATDVSWKIELTGGLIILGKDSFGTIATLNAGANQTVSSKLILGFGKTVITVTAGTDTKTQNATVLLIFIKTP